MYTLLECFQQDYLLNFGLLLLLLENMWQEKLKLICPLARIFFQLQLKSFRSLEN